MAIRTIDGNTGLWAEQADAAALLSKVLAITTVGFLFTAVGAYLAPDLLAGLSFFVLIILNFGLIFAIRATRKSPGLSMTLFYAFSALMGVQISPVINHYLHTAGGDVIVFQSALTTAVGLGVLALVAQVARFDYKKVASIAFAGLIGLLILGVLSMFVHFIHPAVYAWLTLAVFAVLVVVDFMRIKAGGDGATAVELALSIYLDAINIFLALLELFGGRRSER
jgi:modulator of FtsH protease